jgi:hypothetical protein
MLRFLTLLGYLIFVALAGVLGFFVGALLGFLYKAGS